MWQLFLSLPCVKGGGTACRDGGIVLLCFATSTIPQSLRDSSLYTREPPLRRELCKAKAFWKHQPDWWFSNEAFLQSLRYTRKKDRECKTFSVLFLSVRVYCSMADTLAVCFTYWRRILRLLRAGGDQHLGIFKALKL